MGWSGVAQGVSGPGEPGAGHAGELRVCPLSLIIPDVLPGSMRLVMAKKGGMGRNGRHRRRGQGQRQGLYGEVTPASPSRMWPARTRPRSPWRRSSTSSTTPRSTRRSAPSSPRARCWSALRAPARRCWPRPWPARPTCPFFSISGSDFVEMFVGVGASRVRDLFKEAGQGGPLHRLHRRDRHHRQIPGQPHGRQRRAGADPEPAAGGDGRL